MTLFEFILWALVTVLDVGGPVPLLIADAKAAVAYTKAGGRLWLTK